MSDPNAPPPKPEENDPVEVDSQAVSSTSTSPPTPLHPRYRQPRVNNHSTLGRQPVNYDANSPSARSARFLREFEQRVDRLSDDIATGFQSVERRIDRLEERLERIDQRLSHAEGALDEDRPNDDQSDKDKSDEDEPDVEPTEEGHPDEDKDDEAEHDEAKQEEDEHEEDKHEEDKREEAEHEEAQQVAQQVDVARQEVEHQEAELQNSKMPQLVFVDGNFADLAQDMADLLHVGDEVKPLLEQDKKDEVLKKIIIASPALNQISENVFAGAYNLLTYLVLQSENREKLLPRVCENLKKPITSSPVHGPGLALGALSTIFSMLHHTDDTRYNVLMFILDFVKVHSMFDNCKSYLKHLDTWFKDWESDEEDQRKMYEKIADVALDAGEEQFFFDYVIKALKAFTEEEFQTEEAQKLALHALKNILLTPQRYLISDLLIIPAIQALEQSHPVYYDLLLIFAEKDLADYEAFKDEHEGFMEKEHLDDEELRRKMRLLTLTSLAAQFKTKEIPYDAIAEALQIPKEEVEMWCIDAIRAGLIEGKLSQQRKVFLVHITKFRVFGEGQWRDLGELIDVMKNTISNVSTNLKREKAKAEAQKKQDLEDLERKLANTGMGGSGGGFGAGRGLRTGGDRGDRGERAPRKERAEDDD